METTTGVYDFSKKLIESTDASYLVMDYLRDVYHKTVIDMSDDHEAQHVIGYDFSVDGETVEFKADRSIHMTGNIAFEIISNIGRQVMGSAMGSRAKWLLYYELQTGICHKINLQGLRNALDKSGSKTLWKCSLTGTSGGRGLMYSSLCLLIPINWIKSHVETQYQSFNISDYLATRITNGTNGIPAAT